MLKDYLKDKYFDWKEKYESASGHGSTVQYTTNVRTFIEKVINEPALKIKRVVDCPCGDMNWMKLVDFGNKKYIGFDIVDELIEDNKIKLPKMKFGVLDIINDIPPKGELFICRDFFFHIPNESVIKALSNIRASGTKYLMTTSFPWVTENAPIKECPDIYGAVEMGWGFREINVEIQPFNLTNRIDFIDEPEFRRIVGLYKL